MTISRPCPLCGGTDVSIFASMTASQIVDSSPYYDHSAYERLEVRPTDRYGISRCATCGFMFASSEPSERFLGRLYSQNGDLESSVRVFARPERAAYLFKAVSNLLGAIAGQVRGDERGVTPRPIRILDVGCAFGVGSLGLAIPGYPYEIAGVEMDESVRDFLSARGMTVYCSVNEVPADVAYDGILLNDVLEHLPDPVSFVKQLASFSRKGTAAWVNVPNFIGWRMEQVVREVASGATSIPLDLNPWEHLSYFTPSTLDVLMRHGGFERQALDPVECPVSCRSAADLPKALVKAVRDVWRVFRKQYPSRFHTSSIYVKD